MDYLKSFKNRNKYRTNCDLTKNYIIFVKRMKEQNIMWRIFN